MGAIKRFWEEVTLELYGRVTSETLSLSLQEAQRRLISQGKEVARMDRSKLLGIVDMATGS